MEQIPCNFRLLNDFFDQELPPQESAGMNRHVEYCPSCKEILQHNQSVSTLLGRGLDETLARVDFEALEEGVLARIDSKRAPWWIKLGNQLVSKRFYVPAAAAATVIVLFFTFVQSPAPVAGPSAIINSVEGNVGSVMILETEKSHHTILWFSEKPSSGSDDHELQPIQTAL